MTPDIKKFASIFSLSFLIIHLCSCSTLNDPVDLATGNPSAEGTNHPTTSPKIERSPASERPSISEGTSVGAAIGACAVGGSHFPLWSAGIDAELSHPLSTSKATMLSPQVVRVFFGTDRAVELEGSAKGVVFGSNRTGTTSLGVCDVSIPTDPRVEAIARPTWFQTTILRQKEDPKKHVILLRTLKLSQEAFISRAKEKLEKDSNTILIFVHGFNVSFDEAAMRTAQLSYDLGFKGLPIMWTWPSKSALSLQAYNADQESAAWTSHHFENFLNMLRTELRANETTVIAHSMGNRVVGSAMEIASHGSILKPGAFKAVILTAPDVDQMIFTEQMLPAIRSIASEVTVYVSSHDRALQFSVRYHDEFERPTIKTIMEDVDVIDVSPIDTNLIGHFYYGDNTSVVSDMKELLNGTSPAKRDHLKRLFPPPKSYWTFTETK